MLPSQFLEKLKGIVKSFCKQKAQYSILSNSPNRDRDYDSHSAAVAVAGLRGRKGVNASATHGGWSAGGPPLDCSKATEVYFICHTRPTADDRLLFSCCDDGWDPGDDQPG